MYVCMYVYICIYMIIYDIYVWFLVSDENRPTCRPTSTRRTRQCFCSRPEASSVKCLAVVWCCGLYHAVQGSCAELWFWPPTSWLCDLGFVCLPQSIELSPNILEDINSKISASRGQNSGKETLHLELVASQKHLLRAQLSCWLERPKVSKPPKASGPAQVGGKRTESGNGGYRIPQNDDFDGEHDCQPTKHVQTTPKKVRRMICECQRWDTGGFLTTNEYLGIFRESTSLTIRRWRGSKSTK